MKNLTVLVLSIAFCNIAFAGPSTFVEGGLIIGGENGQNGSNEQGGLEVTGSYAFKGNWYAGGNLGRYTRDTSGGDVKNTYVNFNGGRYFPMTDKVDLFLEGGLWFGEQDNPGGSTNDPSAIEGKVGVNGKITDKFSLFGTISLAAGDLDTGGNDTLRDFIWSAGGAYAFTNTFSMNVKVVEGANGVNGQSDVARIGFRWTFK